jgi:hypothetical protein
VTHSRGERALQTRMKAEAENKMTESDVGGHTLCEELRFIVGFFAEVETESAFLELHQIVDAACKEQSTRQLRLISRELDQMALALPPHQREGLEALLLARFGAGKEAARAVIAERIAAVLRRGTIASEKERQHLEDYIEVLEVTGGDSAKRQAVIELLRKG